LQGRARFLAPVRETQYGIAEEGAGDWHNLFLTAPWICPEAGTDHEVFAVFHPPGGLQSTTYYNKVFQPFCQGQAQKTAVFAHREDFPALRAALLIRKGTSFYVICAPARIPHKKRKSTRKRSDA